MKYKVALVVIPAHWDASELVHPSVNEQGRVLLSADCGDVTKYVETHNLLNPANSALSLELDAAAQRIMDEYF
jgi:hypothetical protein